MGKFGKSFSSTDRLGSLTGEHIKTFVKARLKHTKYEAFHTVTIDSALAEFVISSMIIDAKALLATHCAKV